MFSDHFPEGTAITGAAFAKFRQERGTPIAPDGESIPLDMEDLLVSLSARVETIKNYGKDILDVAVRIFNTFWPGESSPETIAILVEKLMEIETQLDLWR